MARFRFKIGQIQRSGIVLNLGAQSILKCDCGKNSKKCYVQKQGE